MISVSQLSSIALNMAKGNKLLSREGYKLWYKYICVRLSHLLWNQCRTLRNFLTQFHVIKSAFQIQGFENHDLVTWFPFSKNSCFSNHFYTSSFFQLHKCCKGSLQANYPFPEIYLVMFLLLINQKYYFKLETCTEF